MEYKNYKSSLIGKFKEFEDYCNEVDEQSLICKKKRFDRLFDNIRDSVSELSEDELHTLVMKLSKDEDVPECIVETLSSIGLIRVMNRADKNDDDNMLALLKAIYTLINK